VAGFIGVSNLISVRADRLQGGLVVMDLGEGERILAPDPGNGQATVRVTVRPEWIKVASGEVGDRDSLVSGTIADVVYLGSLTQLLVDLRTGERLSVHRLNDDVSAVEQRPGERVALHWAAEHSVVIGAGASRTAEPTDSEEVETV
jgi:ABC-type Fe3+/spermidine/putrescine transport system ATPase subunit